MKNGGKGKSGLLIFLLVAALVLAGGSGLIALMRSGYRTIQLYQLDGEAELRRAAAPVKPYVGMMLQSEDSLFTHTESFLYLKIDDYKFMMAEPETRFTIVAEGTRSNSRTKIRLDEGAIVNHVTVPLLDESSYEITTPNSTMAIRGTSFRISVWFDEAGVSHTMLEVFEGTVETRLLFPDGTTSAESRFFTAGRTVTIWGNDSTSDYDRAGEEIDYYALEIPTLEFLRIGAEGLSGYDISRPELEEIIALKKSRYQVSFEANGRVFAVQSVQWNHCAQEPTLKPSPNGSWDFDFSTPITEKTVIQWNGG